MTTHLDLRSRHRRRQFEALLDELVPDRRRPTVLMGDFNEWWPFSRALAALRRHAELPPAPPTFPSWLPILRLDRIAHSGCRLQDRGAMPCHAAQPAGLGSPAGVRRSDRRARRPRPPPRSRPGRRLRWSSRADDRAAAQDALPLGPRRRWSAGFMALLAGVTALAPFSLQIFLPALPAIQASFAVSTGIAQLALSLSILANAFANLAYGPLSDRFGRRPVLLVGLVAFIAGSLGCALAPTIHLLVVGRIVQSIGGAAGMVLARAIVRDLYDRERSASIIAYLTMAMVVAPMLAPTVGAILIDVASWRAIFFLTTGVGVAADLADRDQARRDPPAGGGPGRRPARRRGRAAPLGRVSGPTCCRAPSGSAVFFSFIAGAPYFMMNVLGRSATEYGLWFILISAAFMAGNLVAGRISTRVGLDRMVLAGSLLAVAGAGLAFVLLLGSTWAPLALFGPMMAAGARQRPVRAQCPGGRGERRAAARGHGIGHRRLLPDVRRRPGQPGGRHAPERHALPDGGVHGRLRRAVARGLHPAPAAGREARLIRQEVGIEGLRQGVRRGLRETPARTTLSGRSRAPVHQHTRAANTASR